MPKSDKATAVQYRVLVGINYPPGNRRANPGDLVDDIPPASVADLLVLGVIEAVGDGAARTEAPAGNEPPAEPEGGTEASTAYASDEAEDEGESE